MLTITIRAQVACPGNDVAICRSIARQGSTFDRQLQ